jgi:hypothetical protein
MLQLKLNRPQRAGFDVPVLPLTGTGRLAPGRFFFSNIIQFSIDLQVQVLCGNLVVPVIRQVCSSL